MMEGVGPEMGGSILGCVVFAVFGIVGIAAFGFWLWMLIDAITHAPSENNTKLIWILVIAFTGVIGAAIYYFVQRPKNPPNL